MKSCTVCCPILALILALALAAAPASASVDEGVLAYQQGNFEAAYQAFVPAAEAGDPAAQYGLGVMYYGGRGVDQDYVQSWKWFKLAADQGHELATTQLMVVEAQLTPEQLEQAQAEAASFQPGGTTDVSTLPVIPDESPEETAEEPVIEEVAEPVVEPVVEPVAEPVVEAEPAPDIDTNAIHPNAPEETVVEEVVEEPVLPDAPPLHGLGEAPEAVAEEVVEETPEAAVDEAVNTVTEPVAEPVAQPPALPLPGLNSAAEPEPEPVVEPVAEPVAEPDVEAMTEADGALGTVEEAEYLFYHPKDFTPVDQEDAAHAFAKDQALLIVAVNAVGGAEGPMENKLCQQISGLMMADLMQQAGSVAPTGGDFLGGGGTKPEVRPVAPPTLTDVAPGVQRCAFAFAHNIGGQWTVVEQANFYKLRVPKLYTVTMRYLQDSGADQEMRPAYEAFEVK